MDYLATVRIMLKSYGFTEIKQRNNNHMLARHPDLAMPVFFSLSPRDGQTAVAEVERDVRRLLGIDSRGRLAREGRRRPRPRKRTSHARKVEPAEPRDVRGEAAFGRLDQMMRGRPW